MAEFKKADDPDFLETLRKFFANEVPITSVYGFRWIETREKSDAKRENR